MGLYANKTNIARFFGVSRTMIYSILPQIEAEIEAGRYSKYSIVDGKVNKAVVLDYLKYRRMLSDKRARKYVPPYDEQAAVRCIGENADGLRIVQGEVSCVN